MSYTTKICEHCGAVCHDDDGFCKSCWKKLSTDSSQDDAILEGHGLSEWETFIGKKSSRYMAIYKKNEGKTVFLSMNLAALFFGINWMLYRGMYKYAIICRLLALVVLVATILCVTLPYVDDIHAVQEQLVPYQEYIDNGGERIIYTQDGESYFPDIVVEGDRLSRQLSNIHFTIMWQSMGIYMLVVMLLMAVFGDALYKMHVKKHITEPHKGGGSVASLVCGALLVNLLDSVLISPLTNLALLILTA